MMIGTNQEIIVLLTDGRKRHLATSPGAKRGSSQVSQEEKGEGKMWTTDFIAVSQGSTCFILSL
jgi:hypothetical protein